MGGSILPCCDKHHFVICISPWKCFAASSLYHKQQFEAALSFHFIKNTKTENKTLGILITKPHPAFSFHEYMYWGKKKTKTVV